MEDTRHKPSQEVFDDIQHAGTIVWLNRDYHEDYAREKIDAIYALKNFADNWYSVLGAMDGTNQMIFWHCIKKQATVDFLKANQYKYGYFKPNEKE